MQDSYSSKFYFSLNSTMVRFRSVIIFTPSARLTRVSIPLWFDLDWIHRKCSYWYYKVSIPLWFDLDAIFEYDDMISEESLNSTMVRFRLIWWYDLGRENNRLNSTMVRFRCNCNAWYFRKKYCLNSTMVRFRCLPVEPILAVDVRLNSTMVRFRFDSFGEKNIVLLSKSQFHYGSI